MKYILQYLIALCLIHSVTSHAADVTYPKAAFKEKMEEFIATKLDADDHQVKKLIPCMSNEFTNKIYSNNETALSEVTLDARMAALKTNEDLLGMLLLKCMASTGALDNAIANATNPTKPAEPKIESVNDVLLDFDSMAGQNHRIRGLVMPVGEAGIMFQAKGSMATYLYVDTSQLSRDDRKKLLNDCVPGCPMTVDGVVDKVFLNKGIKATKLWY